MTLDKSTSMLVDKDEQLPRGQRGVVKSCLSGTESKSRYPSHSQTDGHGRLHLEVMRLGPFHHPIMNTISRK